MYRITDEVRVKATKDQPKGITIIEGDALFHYGKKGAKPVEVPAGETFVFDHAIYLKSSGTTRVRLSLPEKPEVKEPEKKAEKPVQKAKPQVAKKAPKRKAKK